MPRLAALLAALLSLTGAARLHAADPLAGFDDLVAKGMKAHAAPGLAVAVVKDGKVVHLKGYGVRTRGQSPAVTGETLFAIGSVSKSFTAAGLAILVDEGKLKWNDPVVKHLKTFRLPNAYLTEETTIRDLLSHRVGIGRNELIWYGSPFDRAEILGKLKDTKPQAKFRTGLVYNNILYMAAGQIVPQVANGKSWDDFVSERLFGPIGMKRANTSVKVLKNFADVATPHDKVKGVPKPIDWKDVDNIGPAGSINASAADLAEYVKFQLSAGRGKDKRLVKRDVFEEMHAIQTPTPKPGFSFNPDALSRGYGLGWFVSDYKGRRLVEHGGNIDGMTAQVGMLPDEKLGVVILANLGGSLLPQALMYDLFDRFLGEPAIDRAETTGLLAWVNAYALQKVGEPDEEGRVKNTKPSLDLEKYAGKYQDELHAPLRVKFEGGKLALTFNGLTFDLSHWHYDTFVGADRKGVLPRVLFTFVLGGDARVAEVRWKLFVGDELKMERKGP